MFDFFKKKKTPGLIIGSPVKGKTVPLSSVNDPTFSEGMLGKGAVEAAKFLAGKPAGRYDMSDVISAK